MFKIYKCLLLLQLLQCVLSANGQNKFGATWVTGVINSFEVSVGALGFQFSKYVDTTADTRFCFNNGSNICDSNGRLLLMSNGFNVLDSNKNYVDGLDSIGGRDIIQYYGFSAYSQASVFLPMDSSVYYFVMSSASDSEFYRWFQGGVGYDAVFDELLYCKIDMKGNGGMGKVVEREIKIVEGGTLSKAQMQACRHANGKDWWLFKHARGGNKVLKFLFRQDSVINMGMQSFAEPVFSKYDGGGQSMFSQDGKKFATTCRGTSKIFVADFDRCTGVLSNPLVFAIDTLSMHNPYDTAQKDYFTEGLAFSPNGRFVYVYMYSNIQQLDLWDSNPATRWAVVAELDTTADAFTSYSGMYLGPDDKLYIGNWAAASKQMSYFNNPNEKGLASDFCPRCLRFPKFNAKTPPNMPNYDLGAEPCWPLGNNEVEMKNEELLVYPNPTSGKLYIKTALRDKRELYNAMGQFILSTQANEIDVSRCSKGVYYIRCSGQVRKVVIE